MNGQKSAPPAHRNPRESGAREKRWNTARRLARLCSFSFSGRLTGHPEKKRRLDAEEAPSGELGCEQRGARAAERVHDKAKASWARERLDERCQGAQRFLRRMQPVAGYFHSRTSGMGAAGRCGLPMRRQAAPCGDEAVGLSARLVYYQETRRTANEEAKFSEAAEICDPAPERRFLNLALQFLSESRIVGR